MPPFPVIDGHNDTLMKIALGRPGQRLDFFQRHEASASHLDYPRAQEGGFAGGFFAIYVDQPDSYQPGNVAPAPDAEGRQDAPLPPPLDMGYAQRVTFRMAAALFELERESAGRVQVVRSARELRACLDTGVLAAIFHIEGAAAIDPELNTLYVLHQAGLRSLGPVWSRPNLFAHGVPFKHGLPPDTGPGLTEQGKALVRACNQLKIMIDLSHLNERGFWDVRALTDAPLVATHSNAYALCHSPRNLTDKQLDAIKESGGMVGVNFHVSFLREDGLPDTETPLATIAGHVDYLVNRMGIDHVGFGSDFDGARIPAPLGDVAGLPGLVDALRGRGYDDAALRKITHENWLRVLGATWGA